MSAANPGPVDGSSTPTLFGLWQVMRQDKRLIVLVTVIGTVLTIAYSLVMPETYSTVATVMPPEKESRGGLSSILSNAGVGLDIGSFGGGSELSKRFVDILKSRTLNAVIAKRCGIADYHQFSQFSGQRLVEEFQKAMGQDLNSNGLVIVSTELNTPFFPNDEERARASELTACVVNAALSVLDSLNKEKSVSTARKTRRYIERFMATNKSRLDSVQDAMERFREQHKILALEEQVQAIVENAVKIGTQIAETEIELELAKVRLAPSHATVLGLEKQLLILQGQYEKIQDGGLVEEDAFSIPLNNIPHLSRQYLNFVRDIKILEQINAFLETQRAQEAIQEERDIPTLHVLDYAVVPERKSAPNKTLMTMFGLVLFAGFGFSLAFIKAVRRGALNANVHLM